MCQFVQFSTLYLLAKTRCTQTNIGLVRAGCPQRAFGVLSNLASKDPCTKDVSFQPNLIDDEDPLAAAAAAAVFLGWRLT